ncbi:hypothetical protein ACMZ6Z_00225 [Streptococcus pluranimalium]|uniref:hypothetical protein n=1 Tax=Streptococcus pluranimalium TaxID=82348 RepID=UPI0039FCB7E6
MTSKTVPYFTFGILFNLFMQAVKPKINARDRVDGKKDIYNDVNVFKRLLSLVIFSDVYSYEPSLSKHISDFKTCKSNSSVYIPMNDPSTIESFSSNIRTNKSSLIKSTSAFVDNYLHEEKLNWLVCAIIETILLDDSIDSNTEFETQLNCTTKKEQLPKVTHIELEIFLISVMEYIISKHPDNKNGRDTFTKWFKQDGERTPWKFVKIGLGEKYRQQISVLRSIVPSFNEDIELENIVEDDLDDSIKDEVPEDPIILDPIDIQEDELHKKNITQVVNNPKVVIQNATNIYNIEHVENLN